MSKLELYIVILTIIYYTGVSVQINEIYLFQNAFQMQ